MSLRLDLYPLIMRSNSAPSEVRLLKTEDASERICKVAWSWRSQTAEVTLNRKSKFPSGLPSCAVSESCLEPKKTQVFEHLPN